MSYDKSPSFLCYITANDRYRMCPKTNPTERAYKESDFPRMWLDL